MPQDSSDWTLERELSKISGQSTLDGALHALGLLEAGQKDYKIDLPAAWIRGGNETYIYPFSIILDSGVKKSFMLKAVVVFSPSRSPDDILREWVSRRQLLASAGVRVPKLLFVGEGLLLEEFILNDLKKTLTEISSSSSLISEVVRYAGILARLGFAPIAPFNDLRTDGTRVIPVDFGEDLGPANMQERSTMRLYKDALNWLRSCGIKLNEEQTKAFLNVFLAESS